MDIIAKIEKAITLMQGMMVPGTQTAAHAVAVQNMEKAKEEAEKLGDMLRIAEKERDDLENAFLEVKKDRDMLEKELCEIREKELNADEA